MIKITWIHLIWLAIFLIFLFKAFVFLDPDFGWHYQMGKLITENGIPKLDQFSYTMPNFLYVDHEWLTDVFIYKLYQYIGTVGLAIVWSVVAMLTINISVTTTVGLRNNLVLKNGVLVKMVAILLGSGLIINQFGIRPQVISWFLASLLFWFLSKWDRVKAVKFIIPLLFLAWANMHGSFVLGTFIFGIFLTVKSLTNKRFLLLDSRLFIFSILVTFLNPYGVSLWREVFNTFFSSTLHAQIEEWQPIWAGLNICYPLAVGLSITLIFRFRNYFKPEAIGIFLVLLLLSFNSLINLPFFGICVLPFLIHGVNILEKETSTIKFGKIRFNKASKFFTGLVSFLFLFSSFFAVRVALKLSEDQFYPKDAIAYIAKNMPSGELFASYNWGGYLIWKFSQKKVFIDGRMAHWPEILDYESKIISGKISYQEVFDKYNIQMVLWPKDGKVFKEKIMEDGWQVVYSDKVSDVLVKKIGI